MPAARPAMPSVSARRCRPNWPWCFAPLICLRSAIVRDAERIATLEDGQKENPLDKAALAARIDEQILTEAGRELAAEVLH